jgi:ribosomal protein S18 acetylase RimI-like enzyme
MQVNVTTWYLEMLSPGDLRPSTSVRPDVIVTRAEIPSPELNRFLYTAVGGDWHWADRLGWSYDRWLAYLERAELETWVAYVSGTPAGYVELEAQPDGNVELAYFGLIPRFIGQRIGGHLLSVGIARGWAMEARRVWVHTCSLDSPHALRNYTARGFRIYNEETKLVEIANEPPGPWPGARSAASTGAQ